MSLLYCYVIMHTPKFIIWNIPSPALMQVKRTIIHTIHVQILEDYIIILLNSDCHQSNQMQCPITQHVYFVSHPIYKQWFCVAGMSETYLIRPMFLLKFSYRSMGNMLIMAMSPAKILSRALYRFHTFAVILTGMGVNTDIVIDMNIMHMYMHSKRSI